MRAFVVSCLFVMVCGISAQSWAHPNVFILLSAQEALPDDPKQPGFQLIKGVKRTAEPVRFGVPLPNDTNAFEANQVILIKTGPYQFKVIKRWPTRRIQWLLVDALVDLDANGQITDMFMTSGADPNPTPMATETPTTITIPTGAATFTINKLKFRLFDKVVVGGKDLIKGNSAGIVLTALDGTQYTASFDQKARVTLEDNGPVRVTVKVEGMHVSLAGKDLLDFTLRMHFYKGKQRVKLVYTLRNASKRRLENVQFRSIELQLQAAWDKPDYLIRDHTGESKGTLGANAKLRLFQGETSADTIRDKGFEEKHWPTGISGYKLTLDGQSIKQGDRTQYISLFYAQARHADGRAIMAGTRFAARYWPQSLGVDGTGTLRVGLFPDGNDKPYTIRFGSHITRECVLYFEAKAAASPRDEFFRFQYPIVMKPSDPDWFNQDEMLFIRLVSFKEEAAFAKDKGWPYQTAQHTTLARRPTFRVPRYIDWGVDLLTRRISPARIATINFMREQLAFSGAYYLDAEQRMLYNADHSVLHSDDYDDRRVASEVPGLIDSQGKVKDYKDLPNADKVPPLPTHWTDKNLHGYSMSLWYHISGNRRIADAYFDWGEHMLRRSAANPDTRTFGTNLFNLVELFRFTRQTEFQRFAWDLLQQESLDKTATPGTSGGTDVQRGVYVGADQAKLPERKIKTFAQARALLGAYALFYENAALDEIQADRARDQLEGLSRYVLSELWRQYSDKPGSFGFPLDTSLDQNVPANATTRPDWAGGMQDAFLALYFGHLLTSDASFLTKAELLLKAAAFNTTNANWFQDLPGRQMVQYLLENIVIYAKWRAMPLETFRLQGGVYQVTLKAPFGARQYWIKYSDKKIVPSLGFDPVTRTYKYDPKTHTPFFAATNVVGEPAPIDPGIFQAFRVEKLVPGKTYYFAARYLTSDPRPPFGEPAGEPNPDGDAGPGTPDAPGEKTGDAPAPVEQPKADDGTLADVPLDQSPSGDKATSETSSADEGKMPVGGGCGCTSGGAGGGWIGLLFFVLLCCGRRSSGLGESAES